MNRPRLPPSTLDARTGLWSFFVRVVLVATVLAVPIVTASFALVSQINHDIALASSEHTTLVKFDRILGVFQAIDDLRAIAKAGNTSGVRRERGIVNRAIGNAQRTYDHPENTSSAFWSPVQARWALAARIPTTANLDAVLESLGEAGNEFEGNSALDQDPNVAVLNIADVFLRKAPRLIVAISRTRDAVVVAADQHRALDVQVAEGITRRRAIEGFTNKFWSSDMMLAMTIEPELKERIAKRIQATQLQTQAFEREVDAVLAARVSIRQSRQRVDITAQRAATAHLASWRSVAIEMDRLVLSRLASHIMRRRIVIAFTCLAILAGAVAVAFISRYEARRDQVELRSAKLESENLRAEVERISIGRDLRFQEAQFRTIFDNADLGIATFDRYGATLQWNAAATRILGTATQELLSQQAGTVLMFEAVGSEALTREETRVVDDDRLQWLVLTFSGVYDEDICQLVILLIRDATEEKVLAQRLGYEARHDGLTGLINRVAFEQVLRQALAEVESAPFAVMYIDLDKFKPINDTFGHRAGDHVLVTTAERLHSAVCAQDVCARLGGDEFAILLRGVDSAGPIAAIAERVAANIALPISFLEDTNLSVTASIGIAVGSPRYASPEEIKHDADLALYAVKDRGRNGFIINQRFIGEVTGLAPPG